MKKKNNLVKIIVASIVILLIVLAILIIALTKEDNNELDLSNRIGVDKYPEVFIDGNVFNAKIVVDDFAPDNELIVVQDYLGHLLESYEMKPDTLIHYKHLSGLYDHNTIFIGTCNMEPHNKFVNLFTDCLSLEENTAIMRLVEKNNITILQVIGKDFQDTEEAVDILINHENYNLSGREIQVKGEGKEIFTRITG